MQRERIRKMDPEEASQENRSNRKKGKGGLWRVGMSVLGVFSPFLHADAMNQKVDTSGSTHQDHSETRHLEAGEYQNPFTNVIMPNNGGKEPLADITAGPGKDLLNQGIETTPTPDQIESTAQMGNFYIDAALAQDITDSVRNVREGEAQSLMFFDINLGDITQTFATLDNATSPVGKDMYFYDNEQGKWRPLVAQVTTLTDATGNNTEEYVIFNTKPDPRNGQPIGFPVLWYKNRQPNPDGSDLNTFMAFRQIGGDENVRILLPADINDLSNNLPRYERSAADQNILTENGYSISMSKSELENATPFSYDQMTQITQSLTENAPQVDINDVVSFDNGSKGYRLPEGVYENYVGFTSVEHPGNIEYYAALAFNDMVIYCYIGSSTPQSGIDANVFRGFQQTLSDPKPRVYYDTEQFYRNDIPDHNWFPPEFVRSIDLNSSGSAIAMLLLAS